MRLPHPAVLVVCLGLLVPPPALARARDADRSELGDLSLHDPIQSPAHWADRLDLRDARCVITNQPGGLSLALTRDVLALQLSDRQMHETARELDAERHKHDDDALSRAVMDVVVGGVKGLLDHSLACDLRDVRDVSWTGGRLVVEANNGTSLFERVDVDEHAALATFDEHDAKRFVRAFRHAKAALER